MAYVFQKTYFRKDPQDTQRVTTKTTVEQETACFIDDGTHLEALRYLRTILHVLPTHLILGTVEDIWCACALVTALYVVG